MSKLIIFGAGDIAQLAHYYFTKDSQHNIAAFTIDKEYINNETYLNIPLLDFETIEKHYPPNEYKMFIALSYAKVNKLRTEKYNQAKEKGYELISYISSRATIFDNVIIGDNCFILEDNTIQPFVKIGNNVTLWSGNHIGHHSVIEDNCFIASHIVISGGVRVEPFCFIGVNSTIRDHVVIARECVIGADCLINENTQEKGVYTSSPAELSKVPSNRLRGI